MRFSLIISSVIIFLIGVLLIKTLWWLLIGIIIGVPLILLSLIMFFLGMVFPSNKKIINIQKNNFFNKNNYSNYNSNSEKPNSKLKKADVVKDEKSRKKKKIKK